MIYEADTISELILISLNVFSTGERERWGVTIGKKYFIGLFHVSEHEDHFKAIQKFHGKKHEGFPYKVYL